MKAEVNPVVSLPLCFGWLYLSTHVVCSGFILAWCRPVGCYRWEGEISSTKWSLTNACISGKPITCQNHARRTIILWIIKHHHSSFLIIKWYNYTTHVECNLAGMATFCCQMPRTKSCLSSRVLFPRKSAKVMSLLIFSISRTARMCVL